MRKIKHIGLFWGILFTISSCQLENASENAFLSNISKTRAYLPVEFDWANIDWMPTPPGQARIPSPWMGAGSIISNYGTDIANDRFKSDGWELVYNTFDPNAERLSNPYFVLYNKYRGTLRFFLYVTTPFVVPSSYVMDGILIDSARPTSLLCFLGKEVVDATKNETQYSQIQHMPYDGSSPLATEKWYMIQYELAYDPNLSSTSNDLWFSIYLKYCNIQTINLGGTIEGTIRGTIGAASSSNLFSDIKKGAETIGTGILAGIGTNFIAKNETNANTGENLLGLRKEVFKSISTGIKSALTGSIKDLPNSLFKGLSAIFGSQNNQPIPVNLQFESTISLKGTISEEGALPVSSFAFWIPGTNITPNAAGQIPLYNKPLGILNFDGCPKVEPILMYEIIGPINPNEASEYEASYKVYARYRSNLAQYLIINPEVRKIADVTIKKQELVHIDNGHTICSSNSFYIGLENYRHEPINGPHKYPDLAVRFTIEVQPKNGDSPSVIIKTFKINSKKEI